MHFINANHLFATNTSSHASQNMTLHMRWNKSVIQAIFPYCKEFTSSIYKSAFFRVKRHESIYKGHTMSPPCVLLVLNSPLTTRRPSQQGGFHQHSTGIEKTCHYTTPLVFRTKVGCVYNFCVKCFKHLVQRMIETGISTR